MLRVGYFDQQDMSCMGLIMVLQIKFQNLKIVVNLIYQLPHTDIVL